MSALWNIYQEEIFIHARCIGHHKVIQNNYFTNFCCVYNIILDIVAAMTQRLDEYKATMVPARNKPADPNANPDLHGGYWVPWIKNN